MVVVSVVGRRGKGFIDWLGFFVRRLDGYCVMIALVIAQKLRKFWFVIHSFKAFI